MARAALAFLLMLTMGAAAKDDAKTVRAAYASGRPFVLIGVPADFLNGKAQGDDVEAQSDWAHYLNEWHAGPNARIKLVVVPIGTYRATVAAPTATLDCITLFVRKDHQALVTSDSCVLLGEEYTDGVDWMGGADLSGIGTHVETLALKKR